MVSQRLGAVVLGVVLAGGSGWAMGQVAGGGGPATRPGGGGAGARAGGDAGVGAVGGGAAAMQQMGAAMVRELRGVEGCLGAEAGQFQGGKFVVMAWFKDKAAAKRWYYHPMHMRMRAAAGMPGEPEGGAKEPPMSEIPDNVPILVVATMTFGGKPIEGSQIPFSGISIELYAPLHEALKVGAGFAPEGFLPKQDEPTTKPVK